ncbi:hypothetical protein GCM10027176_01410 [Actinoallomurus bryophytorum]|uniref:Uncharacterized protein n=1 Tax=Actinoallomurus bryophytorum TaxID=1490222 RepID=A0A543CEB6_9ACTN|nr:hypothetical protein FB559_0939 [Actinoallomurus bryophytorum]
MTIIAWARVGRSLGSLIVAGLRNPVSRWVPAPCAPPPSLRSAPLKHPKTDGPRPRAGRRILLAQNVLQLNSEFL